MEEEGKEKRVERHKAVGFWKTQGTAQCARERLPIRTDIGYDAYRNSATKASIASTASVFRPTHWPPSCNNNKGTDKHVKMESQRSRSYPTVNFLDVRGKGLCSKTEKLVKAFLGIWSL